MSFLTKLGLFAGGALFGTGGVAILSSKDAKKVYTECTAAVLRGKDCVVKQANVLKKTVKILLRMHQISTKLVMRKQRKWN